MNLGWLMTLIAAHSKGRRVLAASCLANTLLLAANGPGAAQTLTPEDVKTVDQLVRSMDSRALVSQLIVVGAPPDSINFTSDKRVDRLAALGIGGLMLNAYNYDKAAPLDTVQSFHQWLRERFRVHGAPPPILFADFERAEDLPIALLHGPPSPLTLAATRDGDLIRSAGRYIGFELKYLGLDAMLGPVLDVDGTAQGKFNGLIRNRAFSSSPELVVASASHFLLGLRDSGVFTFTKHFPGHGYVQGNTDVLRRAEFTGSAENLNEGNLRPFRELQGFFDGVVTSHFTLASVDPNTPITFSSRMLRDVARGKPTETYPFGAKRINGAGLTHHVMISDDLSDMPPIRQWRFEHGDKWSTVALQALRAGHDLLLFAHLDLPERNHGRNGGFEFAQIEPLIQDLAAAADRDAQLRSRLEASVRRTLSLKARLLRQWAPAEPVNFARWGQPTRIQSDFHRPVFDGKALDGPALLAEIAQRGFVELNRVDGFNIDQLKNSTNVDIFVAADSCRPYSDEFAAWRVHCMGGLRSDFSAAKDSIQQAVRSGAYVVLVVVRPFDDVDLAAYLVSVSQSSASRALVIVHTSPLALKYETIAKLNAVGNFAADQAALRAGRDYLSGQLNVASREHIPVTLGQNGDLFDVRDGFLLAPATGVALDPALYSSTRDLELQRQMQEVSGERDELIKQIDMWEARRSTLLEYWSTALRLIGATFALIGLILLGRVLDRVFANEPIPNGQGFWALVVAVALAALKQGFRHAAVVVALVTVVSIGTLMALNVGVRRVLDAVEARIENAVQPPPVASGVPISTDTKTHNTIQN